MYVTLGSATFIRDSALLLHQRAVRASLYVFFFFQAEDGIRDFCLSRGLDYLADYEEVLKTLTDADVQAMAKKVLSDGNLVKVIMRPAKEEAK